MTALTVKPSLAAQALAHCVRIQQPVFMHGGPGICKSALGAQCAETLGMDLIDIRAVLLDPVDLRGLPTITVLEDGTKLTDWAPPAFLPQEGCRPTLVFIDELNRAPMLVQNALFQLILDRRLGEYVLPSNCAIIAAGNRESDGGGVTRMASALSNRFTHLNVEPDLDDWSRWAVQHDVHPMVIAFLRFKPTLLYDFDRNAQAFPTPRSWEFVSRIVTNPGSRDLERAMVTGTVGEGAAIEFLSFVDLYRTLPSIDAILMDPKGAPVPEDVATLYAASSALGARSNTENFGRVITYLDRLPQEFAVFAVRDATTRDKSLATTPEFTKWAVAHADLL